MFDEKLMLNCNVLNVYEEGEEVGIVDNCWIGMNVIGKLNNTNNVWRKWNILSYFGKLMPTRIAEFKSWKIPIIYERFGTVEIGWIGMNVIEKLNNNNNV